MPRSFIGNFALCSELVRKEVVHRNNYSIFADLYHLEEKPRDTIVYL